MSSSSFIAFVAEKKPEVGDGLGAEKGEDMLTLGMPRGSPRARANEAIVGGVKVGGRSMKIGKVCGFAVGGVGVRALATKGVN